MGMIYLLDTNAWIAYLNQSGTSVANKIIQVGVGSVRLCSIVKAELYFGAMHSARRDVNLQALSELFSEF